MPIRYPKNEPSLIVGLLPLFSHLKANQIPRLGVYVTEKTLELRRPSR